MKHALERTGLAIPVVLIAWFVAYARSADACSGRARGKVIVE